MADGYVGLWPLVSAPQGDSSSVSASALSTSSATAENASTYPIAGLWFVGHWLLISGIGAYVGAAPSGADVTGQASGSNVQSGEAASGAQVSAVNRSSNAGGDGGFVGVWPLFVGLQGSTAVLPWGSAWSAATVTGEGVYSVLGDYSTPPRSVFDVPPPADFKIPGLTLDYGLPPSLRPAGALGGEIVAVSYVTGAGRSAVVRSPEATGTSQVAGQLRSVALPAADATAGATVTGVPFGVITVAEAGASSGGATVEAVDRSLPPGAGLGIATATSAIEGEGRVENAQLGAADARSEAGAVNVSSVPQAFTASSSSGGTVSGEAVATVVRVAQAEANAVIAAVQAVIVIAEAAAFSMAVVTANGSALVTTTPGGRWPRNPRRPGRSRTVTTTRSRPVNS